MPRRHHTNQGKKVVATDGQTEICSLLSFGTFGQLVPTSHVYQPIKIR